MSTFTRLLLLDSGLRWANNIIVEVISNHAGACSDETRDALRATSLALSDAAYFLGKDIRKESLK